MKYEIVLAQTAMDDLEMLDSRWRAVIKKELRQLLEHEPKKESKSRIKRLRGLRKPQFRLRIHDIRIFYDVNDELRRVEILGVAYKPDAAEWLKQHGAEDENSHDD